MSQMHHFDVQEAEQYGIEIAIILNHFRFWLTKNRANRHNLIDGYYWTYNSSAALSEIFPYWSPSKIKRLLSKMIELKLLIGDYHSDNPYDRTKWYSMPEFALCSESDNREEKVEQSQCSKVNNDLPDNNHISTTLSLSEQAKSDDLPSSPLPATPAVDQTAALMTVNELTLTDEFRNMAKIVCFTGDVEALWHCFVGNEIKKDGGIQVLPKAQWLGAWRVWLGRNKGWRNAEPKRSEQSRNGSYRKQVVEPAMPRPFGA